MGQGWQDALAQISAGLDAPRRAFLDAVWQGVAALDPEPTTEEAAQLARDILRLFGQHSIETLRARLPMMAARAASHLRAQMGQPGGHAQEVTLLNHRQPYAQFFAIDEYDLRHSRFDGGGTAPLRRAVFVSGDAVTVLPYDPQRDRVLLVQQFRAGPFARGDRDCWQYEPIAGRIDAGETPQQAALREAHEEAGLELAGLISVAEYYPSPGAVSEYLYSFVALCDLPDDAAGLFGLASEGEDIKAEVIGFGDLMARLAAGRLRNAPLILTALWLTQNRARLS